MKSFAAFCLSLAVVLGAALSSPVSTFGCGGGSSGQTGCKVVTSPLTIAGLRFWIGVLDAVIP